MTPEHAVREMKGCGCRYRFVNGDVLIAHECESHTQLRKAYNATLDRERALRVAKEAAKAWALEEQARAEQAEATIRRLEDALTQAKAAVVAMAEGESQVVEELKAEKRRLREALADIYHRWAELQMDKDSIAEDVRQFYVAMDSIPAVLTPPPAQECRINNLMDSNGPRCVTHDRPLDWVECTGWRCEVSGKIVTKGGTDDPGTD